MSKQKAPLPWSAVHILTAMHVSVLQATKMPTPHCYDPSDLGESQRARSVAVAGTHAPAACALLKTATLSCQNGGPPDGWATGSSSLAYDGSYIEARIPRGNGVLVDLSFTCPQGSAAQLSWLHHADGSAIGHLCVRDGTGVTFWVKSGVQGNAWRSAWVLEAALRRTLALAAKKGWLSSHCNAASVFSLLVVLLSIGVLLTNSSIVSVAGNLFSTEVSHARLLAQHLVYLHSDMRAQTCDTRWD